MARVRFKTYVLVGKRLHKRNVTLNAANAKEALSQACETFGDDFEREVMVDGRLSEELVLALNGRTLDRDSLHSAALNDGDELFLFVPLGGG